MIESSSTLGEELLPEPFCTMRRQLVELIDQKTRFGSANIHTKGAVRETASFNLESVYGLRSDVQVHKISGNFRETPHTRAASNPTASAQQDGAARLRLASQDLSLALGRQDIAWDSLRSGAFSLADLRFWTLAKCSPCSGAGSRTCSQCTGYGRTLCGTCRGTTQMKCDNYQCLNGRATCWRCHGNGQVLEVVSRPYTDSNGYTQYRYENEYQRCPEYGCFGGRIQCTRCLGRSLVSCTTCSAMGKVRCAPCFGEGSIKCGSCAATGRSGSLAWADVSLAVEHKLSYPQASPKELATIDKIEGGIEGLAKIARISSPTSVGGHDGDRDAERNTLRTFEVDLFRLTVECDGIPFEIVTYGPQGRWLSTGGVVEHLLNHDLSNIETALVDARRQGWLSRDRATLRDALIKVLASEINIVALTSTHRAGGATPESVAISEDYINRLENATSNAFHLLEVRQAKDLSWRICIATLIAVVLGWSIWGAIEAGAIGIMSISAGEMIRGFFARREMRLIADDAVVNAGVRKRGAVKSTQLLSTGVVVTPALLILVALLYILPSDHPWDGREAEPTSVEDLEGGE